jgi:hypothetical protein
MKHSLTCPRCSGCRIWNLRNAAEHCASEPSPLGAPQGLAPIESFLCDGCGFSEWYAAEPTLLRPNPGASMIELNDHRMSCQRCESRDHLFVARFEEAIWRRPELKGVWSAGRLIWQQPTTVLNAPLEVCGGTLAVVICRSCGFMSWFACGALDSSIERIERSCARCGTAPLERVPSVKEADDRRLPLLWHGQQEIGHYRLDVCGGCGFTDWFGVGYGKLVADGREVFLLEGKAPSAAPTRGGTPYR